MAEKPIDLGLTALDELFMTDAQRQENKLPRIRDIPLDQIDDMPNHPYKVRMDEDMDALTESVRTSGIITPVILRKKEDGRFECAAGHRRRKAAELAGHTTIRAEVREMTRDEAIILMVDSNLQRTTILPSEKAFSYKMRLEAMKRQSGRPKKNSPQVASNYRSDDALAQQEGLSGDTVRRYIRLTNLAKPILELVDEGRIAFSPGVELSYLPPEIQQELYEIIDREDCTPSYSQAFRLHKSFNNCSLTREGLAAVMSEEKPNQKEKVSFKYDDLRKYFPDSYSVGDIQRYILNLVAKDYQRQHNRSRGGDAR